MKIQDFFNSGPVENMMAATNAFLKSKALEQMAKAIEWNIRVGSAEEDSFQEFRVFAHDLVELKLFQKPRVVFVEEADVVDAVAEHGRFKLRRSGIFVARASTNAPAPSWRHIPRITIWPLLFISMSLLTGLQISFGFRGYKDFAPTGLVFAEVKLFVAQQF